MHVLGNLILQSLSVLLIFARAEKHGNRVSSADMWNLMLLFLICFRFLTEESFICAEPFTLALDLGGPCRLEFIRSAQNNAFMTTDQKFEARSLVFLRPELILQILQLSLPGIGTVTTRLKFMT